MWMFYWIVSGGAGLKTANAYSSLEEVCLGTVISTCLITKKLILSMEIAEYRAG